MQRRKGAENVNIIEVIFLGRLKVMHAQKVMFK
jgi:hypothetical protein